MEGCIRNRESNREGFGVTKSATFGPRRSPREFQRPRRYHFAMPDTFEQYGLTILYPENWTVAQRAEGEPPGAMFETPGGGFLSVDQIDGENDEAIDALFEKTAAAIREDYGEVESEEISSAKVLGFYRGIEYRFYYLDLIVLSRLMIVLGNEKTGSGKDWAIQIQAESRDWDANEAVFDAILAQITPPPSSQ